MTYKKVVKDDISYLIDEELNDEYCSVCPQHELLAMEEEDENGNIRITPALRNNKLIYLCQKYHLILGGPGACSRLNRCKENKPEYKGEY